MKKVLLSIVVVIAFVLYAVTANSKKSQSAATAPVQNNSSVPSSSQSNSSLKDGEYTGDATDAFYGIIQVKAIISDGKLADVQFLQYPNDRHESIEISDQSMPILKSEAIQAQSAKVDVVSGATQTSEAFVKSLESALTQAKS